jgi:CheY-like chemotaxis protein
LLADDSVTIQKVVGISFASEDVEVIAVDNGDDAIIRAREALPDVVLADVVMPGKNGYEVCEAIKGDPARAHIPVLLLTGTFEAFDEARAQQAGATGHIAKPFEAQALVDEVRRLFSIAAATPAAAPAESVEAPEVAAEPVEEASPANDDAFDFFDDEPAEVIASPSDGAVDDAAPDLEFQSPDTAYEFGHEDLATPDTAPDEIPEELVIDGPTSFESSIPVAPDSDAALESVEVMDGDALAGATRLDAELEELSIEPDASPIANEDSAGESLVESASTSAEEPFDFAVETAPSDSSGSANSLDGTDPVLPIDADDLAQGTIIDPKGASGYDVSSSDLGPAPTDEPLSDGPADSGDAISGYAEPMSGLVEPDATILAPLLPSVETPDSDPGEPVETDPEPVAIAVEESPPSAPAEEIQVEPIAVEESNQPAAPASAERLLENIEPVLRQQLHDTLEKIAWESFGEITETIVRQSVERVEAIAWEVIPQMAETLIQEEIRQLKGEPPDDA